jgi:hypothetical protein
LLLFVRSVDWLAIACRLLFVYFSDGMPVFQKDSSHQIYRVLVPGTGMGTGTGTGHNRHEWHLAHRFVSGSVMYVNAMENYDGIAMVGNNSNGSVPITGWQLAEGASATPPAPGAVVCRKLGV